MTLEYAVLEFVAGETLICIFSKERGIFFSSNLLFLMLLCITSLDPESQEVIITLD